jgi:hypothetical protein
MASTSETGHAKNIANFQSLISFVTSYGSAYNPSKQNLQLTALNALKLSAEAALADVLTKNTFYSSKVNERANAFSDLKTLSTRLLNALQATQATTETINDAKIYNRKIQGKRASTVKTPTGSATEAPKTISTSQLSYDQQIQHLSGLKTVLESEPSYFPNETELKISTLNTKIADLYEKNSAVSGAYAAISNSRIARNQTLYTNENGVFETANDVKKYIKSVFGADSPQFAQIKGLEFKKHL